MRAEDKMLQEEKYCQVKTQNKAAHFYSEDVELYFTFPDQSKLSYFYPC